jgi:hypothetical protein
MFINVLFMFASNTLFLPGNATNVQLGNISNTPQIRVNVLIYLP